MISNFVTPILFRHILPPNFISLCCKFLVLFFSIFGLPTPNGSPSPTFHQLNIFNCLIESIVRVIRMEFNMVMIRHLSPLRPVTVPPPRCPAGSSVTLHSPSRPDHRCPHSSRPSPPDRIGTPPPSRKQFLT